MFYCLILGIHMKRIDVLIFCLVLLVTFNSCEVTGPLNVDYHNKILITSHRSGKGQLYMISPDGSGLTQITSGANWHNGGRWSPDAQKIVCNTAEGLSTAGEPMVVMNSDGGNRVLLGIGTQMSWHPGGVAIIFSYWPGAESGIYNMRLCSIKPDGSERKAISYQYAGTCALPPDGTRIAFAVKPDSLTRTVILDFPQFSNPVFVGPTGSYGPCWSQDGKEIAISAGDTAGQQICIMNADGSNVRMVTDKVSHLPFIYPRWSPDAGRLIFLAYTVDGTAKSYLYMIDRDGSNLHRVIDDDLVTSCDWSR